jgi:putative FmdB family regulatory protein
MPTYAYRCEACDHEFELFQSITANAIRKCPGCKKLKIKRLIGTGAGIIFKGSGFYETDYRSESYKKGAEKEKKASEPKKDTKDAKKSSNDTGNSSKSGSDSKDTGSKKKSA